MAEHESTEEHGDILALEKIPFMHFGVISRYNFYNLKNVPLKRWDPLGSQAIELTQSGHTVTLMKKHGQYSYISPIRSERVNQFLQHRGTPQKRDKNFIDLFKATLDARDYFDENNQKIGDAYSITVCDGKNRLNNPFSVEPRIQTTDEQAITFINKFPAMCRVMDPEIKGYIEKNLDENAKIAMGVNLISTTRDYAENIENISTEALSSLFISMIEGIKYVIDESARNDIHIMPISPFFNIGDKAGGSVPRLHAQVYIDLVDDGHGSRMENILRAFEEMKKKGSCHLCQSKHESGNRVIAVSDYWILFSSGSPLRNFHLRLCPREHIEQVEELKEYHIIDLSKLLQLTSKAMTKLGIEQNRNLIFNTKPHGYESYFHLFLDLIPFETVGGAEVADSMRVVRISPLVVADDMRNAMMEISREES